MPSVLSSQSLDDAVARSAGAAPASPCTALETRLAAMTGRRHAVVAGRATSALYATFEALAPHRRRVVFPAICCPAPVAAALHAGLEPLFCDIELDAFGLCPHALDRLLDAHRDVCAVVLVHLYGTPAALDAVEAVTRRHGVTLIEDAAQALGGSIDDRPLGGNADVSLLSFGSTKIADAGWGGAALTDDDALASRLREARDRLPERPADLERLEADYRSVFYQLLEHRDRDPRLDALFDALPEAFRDTYLYGPGDGRHEAVRAGLEALPEALVRRRRLSARYRRALCHPLIRHAVDDPGAAPWRHTVLIGGGRRRAVTDALRAAGLPASNWYHCLHRWHPAGRRQDENALGNARRLERDVLNLWVDDDTDDDRVDRACEVILDALGPPFPSPTASPIP